MGVSVIGQNIRKLREERSLTQQQLADALHVSFQAVSKWECGTTVPDTAMLPEIADIFNISIDELFKANMTAYRHKAERLLSLYESCINNSEAYERAEREYQKLFSDHRYTAQDLGDYAYLIDLRSRYFLNLAESYYKKAISEWKKQKDDAYYKIERQYILFLSRLGRDEETIQCHVERLSQEPDHPMNYASLVSAYKCANDDENAIKIAEQGLERFPNDAILLVYAGDTYKNLGRTDDAIRCWNKAFEIDPEMIDAQFSLAFYMKELGEYEKARDLLKQIIEWQESRGYHVESKWAKAKLRKLEQMK